MRGINSVMVGRRLTGKKRDMKNEIYPRDAKWRIWLSGLIGRCTLELWARLHERANALRSTAAKPALDWSDWRRRMVRSGRYEAAADLLDAIVTFLQALLSRRRAAFLAGK